MPLGGTWALVTVRSQHQPEAEEGMLAAVGWGESQGGRTPYFLPCLGQRGQNWPFSESQANRAPPRTGTGIITNEGYVFHRQYTPGRIKVSHPQCCEDGPFGGLLCKYIRHCADDGGLVAICRPRPLQTGLWGPAPANPTGTGAFRPLVQNTGRRLTISPPPLG